MQWLFDLSYGKKTNKKYLSSYACEHFYLGQPKPI